MVEPLLIQGTKTLAQQRRLMENHEFSELAKELPLSRAISAQHIDKTTMVRLAVSFIKLHNTLRNSHKLMYTNFDAYWSSNLLDLMDSFLMVLDSRGDVLYVSETISIYLGLSQVEMTGNSIREYVHPDDYPRFQTTFQCYFDWMDSCNVRLKSSLTKRANKDSVRSSPGYKVLKMDVIGTHCGRLLHCIPLPSLVLSTVSILPDSFVITTNVDLTIIGADDKSEELFGNIFNRSSSLRGMSFYMLIHVADTDIIGRMHYEIISLGAYRTPYFRMSIQQTSQTIFVEATVFRYSSIGSKSAIDTITFVICRI